MMIKEKERNAAESDAELIGIGFIVDGKRVEPNRVVIIKPKTKAFQL